MKLAGFQLLCRSLVLSIFSSAADILLMNRLTPTNESVPLPVGSPGKIVAVVGKDVRLPCDVGDAVACFHAVTVEWLWTDGESRLRVHVHRQGKSLTKEQAEEYRGRTGVTSDCSLTLRELRVRDAGTYRCVLRGSKTKEASVSLDVVEVFEVNLSVQRTSDNQLIIRCKSSGWSQEPVVSLLDSQRNNVTNQIESSDQPDGLYTVQASLNLTAAAVTIKNGTLICRAEISGMNLWNETQIDLTDEFYSSLVCEAARCHTGLVVLGILLLGVAVGIVVLVLVVHCRKRGFAQISSEDSLSSEVRDSQVNKVPSHSPGDDSSHGLTASFETEHGDIMNVDTVGASEDTARANGLRSGESEGFTEYGDINKVDTAGASEDTARANGLRSGGIEASREMAEKDEEEMRKYKEQIIRVGQKLKVHPALIAAIISRQSQAGKKLRPNGYGKFDFNCFGLMQINKAYHGVTRNPYDEEHVQQGVFVLIQGIKTMEREKKDWTKEQRLKGALASYIAGVDKVLQLDYKDIDSVTPYKDFASDVIARAQWFADNGYQGRPSQ